MAIGDSLRDMFANRPVLADSIIALLVTATNLFALELPPESSAEKVDLLAIVLVVIPGLATFFRRTYPVRALAVATVLGLSYWILDYPGMGAFIAIATLLFSVAVYASERRRSTQALVVFTIVLLFVLVSGYLSPNEDDVSIGTVVLNLVMFQLVWLAGDALRNRRRELASVKTEMQAAQLERQTMTERAVDAERSRIARELHDIVAHAMSVIVIQAEGARRLVGKDDEMVKTALAAIEHTGRTNLNDIRGVVGLLRTDGTEYAPAPALTMISQLVEQSAEAGLQVSLDVEGAPRPLPTMVELSGYRIVQESLTNVMKHAGPAVTANVNVCYEDDHVEIVVSDNGRGAAADTPTVPGNGILGMRERVEAFGGRLHSGPRAGGGFLVRATIPVEGDR